MKRLSTNLALENLYNKIDDDPERASALKKKHKEIVAELRTNRLLMHQLVHYYMSQYEGFEPDGDFMELTRP